MRQLLAAAHKTCSGDEHTAHSLLPSNKVREEYMHDNKATRCTELWQ